MDEKLPLPPLTTAYGQVTLSFGGYIVDDDAAGITLGYHFRILDSHGRDAGHLNFRIGDTERITFCIGHIGYAVHPEYRGHGYALQACLAIAEFVERVKGSVIITADSDNLASIRTIERLGAVYVDEYTVPADDPAYFSGSRIKRRYRWSPTTSEHPAKSSGFSLRQSERRMASSTRSVYSIDPRGGKQ